MTARAARSVAPSASAQALAPLVRTISVSWAPGAAFRRFTTDVMTWWPHSTHSIGGPEVKRVVFEPRVGGKFFEELRNGRRFQWGEVLEWDPPRRVKFTFHPSQDPKVAQDVDIRFEPDGTGTKLTLTVDGWERLGAKSARARKGYDVGWGYVLNVWAGRRTTGMMVMDVVAKAAGAIQLMWYRGRNGMIGAAKGELRMKNGEWKVENGR